MITITIDNPNLESAAIVALADALKNNGANVQSETYNEVEASATKASTGTRRRNNKTEAAQPEPENTAEPDTPEVANNAAPSNDDESKGEPAPAEDVPSFAELRAKAAEVGQTAEGRQSVKALLEEFGCKSLSLIPEGKRAEFLARLQDL